MSQYRFDNHTLDPQARTLTCDGHATGIEPRVFDVVVYLIRQRHRAVGRDELIAAAWGRADCSDATLAQAILKARRLFGDSGEAQRTIRTAPRFGYQWVAPTQEIENEPSAELQATSETPAAALCLPDDSAAATSTEANASVSDDDTGASMPELRASRRRRRIAIAATAIAACFALAILGTFRKTHRADDPVRAVRSQPGLVLVEPAEVHSALPQDGWIRLGLMAMGADAVRDLPGRTVVPTDTVLSALRNSGSGATDRLRALTGASTIVTFDARRSDGRWSLDATVLDAGGQRQVVSVEADDAVAAASALSERLRRALGGAADERDAMPATLATSGRMQAAILDGHPERALDIASSEDPTGAVPEISLLRAGALNRLGKAEMAVESMHALIARAGTPAPRWLASAWRTLGYGEMLLGHAESAEAAFRRVIATAGDARSELVRGWRGLGTAQAMRAHYAEAEESALRASLELGENGDPLMRAHIEDDLGTVASHRGRYDAAITYYRRAADEAAAVGATELELGSRMNIALSQTEQLQHTEALQTWRSLLPRLQAIDYPSMQRYASVHYAQALAETGALAAAKTELERTAALAQSASPGRLDDAGTDALYARAMLGTDTALCDDARRQTSSSTSNRRSLAASVLATCDIATGDDGAIRDDTTLLARIDPGPDPLARAELLGAQAALQVRDGEAAAADQDYARALALVRESGSPRDLRDIALPYAAFQLSRADVDAARNTAGLIQPHADQDYPSTLLLARVAAAASEPAEAARLYQRARRLVGTRTLPVDASAQPALADAIH